MTPTVVFILSSAPPNSFVPEKKDLNLTVNYQTDCYVITHSTQCHVNHLLPPLTYARSRKGGGVIQCMSVLVFSPSVIPSEKKRKREKMFTASTSATLEPQGSSKIPLNIIELLRVII